MFKTYYQELLQHFTRRTGNRHAAEDAVMEAYARALEHQRAGHTIAQPRAFLYRSVRNLLNTQAQRAALEAEILNTLGILGTAHAPSPEQQVDARLQLQRLQQQLADMPEKRRNAFVLVRVHGMDYAEAADYLNTTATSIEKHINRALHTLNTARRRDAPTAFNDAPPATLSAPSALVDQALLLLGRLQYGEPHAARKAQQTLQQWGAQTPHHALALKEACQLWALADGSALQDAIDLPPSAHALRAERRHNLGQLGIVALVLAGGGSGARWYWQQPTWQMELQTGRGEHLRQRMHDGSIVQLAANTLAHARLYRQRRVVQLAHGEMAFDVQADAQRPFIVETAWGQVRVLGTRFTVASDDQHLRVAVASGRVAVFPQDPNQPHAAAPARNAIVLTAGDSLILDATGQPSRQRIDSADVADWTQGWLIFENTALPQAVARWNHYLRAPIRLSNDSALHTLRISGRYRLQDPTAFIQALRDMAGLRATHHADGSIQIAAARGRR